MTKEEMIQYLKENLSIGIGTEGTSIEVKLWLDGECISECTESITVYERDIYSRK